MVECNTILDKYKKQPSVNETRYKQGYSINSFNNFDSVMTQYSHKLTDFDKQLSAKEVEKINAARMQSTQCFGARNQFNKPWKVDVESIDKSPKQTSNA